MSGFMHAFIHDFKHGISAISTIHSAPIDDGAYLAASVAKEKVGCSSRPASRTAMASEEPSKAG